MVAEKSTGNLQHFAMKQTSRKPSGIFAQSHALMMKNLTIQKRSWIPNAILIIFPALTCLLFYVGEKQIDEFTKDPTMDTLNNSDARYARAHPTKTPPLFRIPLPEYRATREDNISNPNYYPDLPRNACRAKGTCPVSILFTGMNRTTAEKLGQSLYGSELLTEPSNSLDLQTVASRFTLGTYMDSPDMVLKPDDDSPLYIIQQRCRKGLRFRVSMEINGSTITKDVECVKGLHLWREKYADIVHELTMGNSKKRTDQFFGVYDFLNTNERTFNVTVWYNSTESKKATHIHILRAINMASNSYLQNFKGSNMQMLLNFVKDMPKREAFNPLTGILDKSLDFLQPLLFLWIIMSLVPIMLHILVYEKNNKLRMIMKMHGLGDLPYWMISYAYFLLLSSAYMLSLVLFGSLLGIKMFTLNDVSVQFVFYFVYINVQISFTIVLSTVFSDVKTSSVIGAIYVFGGGLLSCGIGYIRKVSSSLNGLQAIPSFALFDILYELKKYSGYTETLGETCGNWRAIASDKDGLLTTLIIMMIEWPILLLIAYYVDQVGGNGSGVRKHPLWFLPCFRRSKRYEQNQGHEILVSLEKSDVSQEREKVERLLQDSVQSHKIIVDDLRKTYPRRDGNPVKHAVRGLSLAVAEGECLGMLGPNGAGKTSFISMMTGLTTPTSGAAFVEGLDIRVDMDKVYTRMGVCPQHDLLWEVLTGREHLYFYGRLKNLRGEALILAVEDSLASVNLSEKGNTRVGRYSGGMKRRLSVAISLIGDPKAVYMDEPSTGLDPASRKSLWSAVEQAKKNKAIILTTHSMEEAEYLCDRVGIFVDGSLQCIGHPKELRERYGGYFLLTITTPINQVEEVEKLMCDLSPTANKVYHISGTQKYHLSKQEVTVADIFKEVEHAKKWINIEDWGLATATLEDVFIKVTNNERSSS